MLAMPNPLQSAALARPNARALLTDDSDWTWQQLAVAVACRAKVLVDAGVVAGHRVGLLGQPSADWLVSMHAIGWLGAAVLPLPQRVPEAELRRCIAVGAPDWLVLSEDVDPATVQVIRNLRGVQVLGASDIAAASSTTPVGRPERFWPLEEVRLVMLTSGTTAAPRAVELTCAQLAFSAMGAGIRLGHHLDDCWLACLPLNHVGGLSIFFRSAWFATAVTLHARFDAARVARALDDAEVSLVSMVPRMLEEVLAQRAHMPFPERLRAILLGGAPASAQLLERCRAIKAPVAVTWGMTETASQAACTVPGDLDGPLGDCGPPQPFARIDGRSGILTVRGLLVSAPLITGDRGFVDAQGHVRVEGRRDDVILSGGENIAPEEIESVLRAHPAISDAAVVGVPDTRWGQRPIAALVAAAHGVRPDDATLDAWCRERLAAFKVPQRYMWLPQLPRDPLGKLRRRDIPLDIASDDRSVAALDLQPEVPQAVAQRLRHGDGPKIRSQTALHNLRARAYDTVGPLQLVVHAQRAAADAHLSNGDINHVAHANRRLVVRLAVDHRHDPVAARKACLQGPKYRRQNFFKRDVAVLKYARKKNNAGAIDLKETSRDTMLKWHAGFCQYTSRAGVARGRRRGSLGRTDIQHALGSAS